MSQERLHHVCNHLVRFLRQASNYARTAEMESFGVSLGNAANGLEKALREALAAPAEESRPHQDSFVDTLLEAMNSDPKFMPTRAQILWTLGMLRAARKLARRYLGAAEITEPAGEIKIAQDFLDEIEEGPTTKK